MSELTMDLEDGELASSDDDFRQDSGPSPVDLNSSSGKDMEFFDDLGYNVLDRPKSISAGLLTSKKEPPATATPQTSSEDAQAQPFQSNLIKASAPWTSVPGLPGEDYYANYKNAGLYKGLGQSLPSLESSDKDSNSSSADSDSDDDGICTKKKSRMVGVGAPVVGSSSSSPFTFSSLIGSSSSMAYDGGSSGNTEHDMGLSAFNAHAANFQKQYRKPNLIWANVVQEEQITDIFDGVKVAEPGIADVEVTRGPETYSFQRPMRQPRERRESDSSDISSGGLSDNALSYLRDGCSVDDEETGESSEHSLPKSFTSSSVRQSNSRKATKKIRARQKYKRKLIKKLKKMKAEELGNYMAKKLMEEKASLMVRAVEILGKENCIHIFLKTLKIERRGGVMVKNHKRRRTPGGVFLYLVRGDRRFPKSQIDLIFREDRAFHDKFKRKKQVVKRWKAKARLESELELGMKDDSEDDSEETAVLETEQDGTDPGQLGDDSTQESSARDTATEIEMQCDGSES